MGWNPEVLRAGSRLARSAKRERGLVRRRAAEKRAYPGEQAARRLAADERRQIVLGPLLDVVFQEMLEHRRMTLAALFQRHLERSLQRRGDRIGLMRVDDQRSIELLRGAGELR